MKNQKNINFYNCFCLIKIESEIELICKILIFYILHRTTYKRLMQKVITDADIAINKSTVISIKQNICSVQ